MIRTRLNDSLKDAMRAKDTVALSTLRLILAALKDRDIAARGKGNTDGISDEEIFSLLQTMIRQRRESIKLYEEGGRCDLAQSEAEEIVVIERFLPSQMDEGETSNAVQRVIAEIHATGLKDMGRTMAELRSRYGGQMDFSKASGIVKSALA
ncbi:MAG: GatB/YqeY domain-containing protein [Inquilinaceae bacterium]